MAESEQSDKKDKSGKFDGRILRSRHYKRPFEDSRPVKRLFTPEIKRHLKSWLIRRRENPYPNREEKIELAAQTGLTYIQICNWFANWRRKLKNSGKNISKFTWSTLIKSYNDQALGNVEHLSISSDDSIWEEPHTVKQPRKTHPEDHSYTSAQINSEKAQSVERATFSETTNQSTDSECLPQCFQISSTTDFIPEPTAKKKVNFMNKSSNSTGRTFNKYLENKHKKTVTDKNWNYKRMIEELRASAKHIHCSKGCQVEGNPLLLSKWRKSAVLFQPNCNIYSSVGCLEKKTRTFYKQYENLHGREELDAAEALTFLSRASANKFLLTKQT